MDKTHQLMPGYVKQGFAYAQGTLYRGAEWGEEKHVVLKHLIGRPVKLLSTAMSYVETPLKIIEDVALLIINLIGAIFKEGCRRNLKYNAKQVGLDILHLAQDIMTLRYLWRIVMVVHVFTATSLPLSSAKTERYKHLIKFYKISAMRIHGPDAMKKHIRIFLDGKKATDEDKLKVYKKLATLSARELNAFIREFKKTEAETNSEEIWECPEDLKNDKSKIAKPTRRILHVSSQVNFEGMTPYQKKAHLCNLLGVAIDSTTAEIQRAKAKLTLLLMKGNQYCQEAIQHINTAWAQAAL